MPFSRSTPWRSEYGRGIAPKSKPPKHAGIVTLPLDPAHPASKLIHGRSTDLGLSSKITIFASSREALRVDEVGVADAQGEIARPRKTVVVIHLHGGGLQSVADSKVAGGSLLKRPRLSRCGSLDRPQNPIWPPFPR